MTRGAIQKLVRCAERRPVITLVLMWLALALLISVSDGVTGDLRRDFTSYSLAAAKTMYAGGNPYAREDSRGSYKYFPLNATLLWPFTKLPVPVAQGVWTATNATLLLVCLWAHRRLWAKDLRVPWWVWAIALGVALRFFVKNLRLGQWNTSVYCLSFLGLTLIYRGREYVGAALTALAAGLKYLPSFFVLFLLIRRRPRAAASMVAAYVFWVLILPTLVLGPQRHAELLRQYWTRATKQYQGMVSPEYTSSLSLRSTVMRMTSEVKPRLVDPDTYDVTIIHLPKDTARTLSEIVAYVVLGATVLVTVIATRREREAWGRLPAGPAPTNDMPVRPLVELVLIGLWYTTFLMISPESRSPHFLTLFTPAFAVATVLANCPAPPTIRRCTAIFLGAAVAFLLLSAEVFKHATYHLWASGLGAYAWAQVALWVAGVLTLFGIVLRNRPCGTSARV